MPLYSYTATDHHGKKTQGTIDAGSIPNAYQKLREKQLFPLEVKEDKASSSRGSSDLESLSYSFSQFASLLNSGIPMDEALESLSEFDQNPAVRSALARVRNRLREGSRLAGAMEQESIFPGMLTKMVQAGEESGKPGEVIGRYADFMRRDIEHRRAMVGALIYPVILLGTSILLLCGILMFLTPVIEQMYGRLEIELPWLTYIMIAGGSFLRNYGLYTLIGILVFVLFLWLVTSVESRQRTLIRLPLVGPLVSSSLMALWSRTFSLLQGSGIPMLRSLQLSREALHHEALGKELVMAESSVEKGKSLTQSLSFCSLMPPLILQFVKTGERSGQLAEMMERAADFYTEDLERRRAMLMKFLEPALIVFMAIVVGSLVLSVLLPLSEIASKVSQ